MTQIVASLTDDSRGAIYDCSIFIIQATGCKVSAKTLSTDLKPFSSKFSR